jgi:O-antigen ligase
VDVKRADLLGGSSALEKLGIGSWKPSRNWRSTGFYGHYVTYAEVLQLLASLVFGLLIVSISGREKGENKETEKSRIDNGKLQKAKKERRRFSLLLAACLGGMLFALLLTSTRASQAAFLVSAFAVVFAFGNRRMLLLLAAVILPLALGGLFFLQQSRNVGFYDTKDDSILWRQTVYREGFNLATANARHVLVGVGMDSIKRYAKDWHLFDDGRLPMGHFHSTPLQLFVERGLPALFLWLWVLWIYARLLWQNLKSRVQNPGFFDWRETGIVLGSFGGLIGFFTSGLVHYNYGDAVVAMMFFILMGLSVKIVLGDKQQSENELVSQ